MYSEEVLRDAAAASFINAQSLLKEAELLSKHGYLARAAALAIIGLEEFAKSIVYTVAALLPEERSKLPAKLSVHEEKHIVVDYAEYAKINCEDFLIEVFRDSGYPPSRATRLGCMFQIIARYGLSGILWGKGPAKEHYKKRQGDVTEILVEPYLKNAALYVDIGPTGKVSTPQGLFDPAEGIIGVLEWFLAHYEGLAELLEDDAEWTSFSKSFRAPSPS